MSIQWIAETYRVFTSTGTKHIEVKGADRMKYISDVYTMVISTYQKIGVPISSESDLLKYPIWWLYQNEEGTPIAFNCFKDTPYGKKSGLSGSDMSPEGKATVVNLIRTKFKKNGIFGEVSHKVEEIAIAAGAPVVPARFVEEILGKPVEIQEDGFHYIRNISGVGRVKKIMVGKPKGVPTKTKIATNIEDASDWHNHVACLILGNED